MPKIIFENESIELNVNSGTNLRKAALKNGVQIYQSYEKVLNCHGLGMCGTCVVEVSDDSDVSPKRRSENKTLDLRGRNGDQRRLACQCQVYGTVKVKTLGK